jgi:hypothetical protein
MATFTWSLQGTADTTIEAGTDTVQFAGGSFDGSIIVGSHNDSTHVKGSGGADDSSGNTPNNVKYISSTQGDWGDGTEGLGSMTTGEATLKINFAHGSAVSCSSVTFYAYDDTTTTNGPTGVTFYAAEQGDSSWTNAEGSGSALSLDDSGSSTSHDFYVACSCSPDSVGTKGDFALRMELTYS